MDEVGSEVPGAMILAGLSFSAIDPLGFIVGSSLVGYDGG
jgi:hypothetical protein